MGSSGKKYNPWQMIWADGLDMLGASEEQEDVYVVCWDQNNGRFDDVFKAKLRQGDIEDWRGSGQTKWVYDDFDPAYGLEGEVADSILDWERRMIVGAARRFPNLRIRYINPWGDEAVRRSAR